MTPENLLWVLESTAVAGHVTVAEITDSGFRGSVRRFRQTLVTHPPVFYSRILSMYVYTRLFGLRLCFLCLSKFLTLNSNSNRRCIWSCLPFVPN